MNIHWKDNHCRRSSLKCPFTTRKPKETHPQDYHYVTYYSVFKTGFRSILKNKHLEHIVNDWVHKATRICYESSLFMSWFLLKCFEESIDPPEVDRNFIRQCMSLCCSNTITDPESILTRSYGAFKSLLHNPQYENQIP